MKSKLSIAIVVFLACFIQALAQGIVNPLQYGLNEAKNGIERYSVLLKCHQDAVKRKAAVSYYGIGSIEIEIPEKFTSIPLTANTDFAECTIKILNKQKNVYLYRLNQKTKNVEVTPECIDNADFRSVDELKKGNLLLIIDDKNPWVDNRIGYNYGHTRKDVMLIKNGIGSNKPVMPYNNTQSKAECSYCEVDLDQKVIKNLKVERDAKSTAITNILRIEAQNNVMLEKISVITPEGSILVDDRMIRIENCTNVRFENISVKGTYSAKDHSGYAFFLNNVWNHTAYQVVASGNWGVYGNNNINTALIEKCDLNRFDIHCYGRDITSKGTIYRDLYTQFSATYGSIRFEECTFINCIPFTTSASYNAFVPVNVTFDDCTFNVTQVDNKKTCIVKISGLSNSENKRPELKKKCVPNFTLQNCTINIAHNLKHLYFINLVTKNESLPIGYISLIKMKNVTINGNAKFDISNVTLNTENPLEINLTRVYRNFNGTKKKLQINSENIGKNITLKYNKI